MDDVCGKGNFILLKFTCNVGYSYDRCAVACYTNNVGVVRCCDLNWLQVIYVFECGGVNARKGCSRV